MLKRIDSIYSQYSDRTNLRLKRGESNILEKNTAENLKYQANIQLNAIRKDREITLQQLDFLINDGNHYINEKGILTIENQSMESLNFENHWLVQQMEKQRKIENARFLVEKSKLLPSFSVGYSNLSMREIYKSDRLYTALFGLNVPIFNSGQKSLIEGQKINQKIADNNKQLALRNLTKQWQDLLKNYEKVSFEVAYYQDKGIKNSEEIIKTATRQFYEGEINFLEWSIVVNQALDIQNQYINKVKELNDRIIEMNSLIENQ